MYKKKKYYNIYIIKIYDVKRSHVKKKLNFNIFLGFENEKNKNYLNVTHISSKILNKTQNDFVKIIKDVDFLFSIEKLNPYILNIKKLDNNFYYK